MNDTISPGWSMPAPRLGPPTCTLCGRVGETEEDPLLRGGRRWDVAPGLVKWADPEEHEGEVGSVVRCRDHEGCRDRVHGHGLLWEVADGHEDVGPKAAREPTAEGAVAGTGDSVWDEPA